MKYIISVVICTYNRKKLLSKTIDSVINQSLNKSNYEIIVVDNNSNDGTSELLSEYCIKNQNIRHIVEPNQGISFSRNCGWKNSEAKYIAYIDDDEIADHYWLENLHKTIKDNNGSTGAVGGRVDPVWETDPPEWLNDELSVYFSIFNLSENTIKIDQNQGIGSGNAIYPREILKLMGGFDTELKSRVGNSLVSSEDTMLHKKIMLSGYNIYYEPGAVVKHLVHSERTTRLWLMKRFFWAGYSHSYIDQYLLINVKNESVFLHKCSHFFLKTYNIFLNLLLVAASPIIKNKDPLIYICRTLKNAGYIYKIII